MIDLNYDKYADYLDPNSDTPKLVKNAPESAKRAFAESKKNSEDFNPGEAALKYLKSMDKREKAKSKK